MPKAVAIEVVQYASSTVRCPLCRQWRASLNIHQDGMLMCAGCPAHQRMTQPRKKGVAA